MKSAWPLEESAELNTVAPDVFCTVVFRKGARSYKSPQK